MQSSGQNCCFKNVMAGAMESDEVSNATLINDLGFESRSICRVVTGHDFEFVPATAVLENSAFNCLGFNKLGTRIQSIKCRTSDEQHIIRDVKYAEWILLQVPVRAGYFIEYGGQFDQDAIEFRSDARTLPTPRDVTRRVRGVPRSPIQPSLGLGGCRLNGLRLRRKIGADTVSGEMGL